MNKAIYFLTVVVDIKRLLGIDVKCVTAIESVTNAMTSTLSKHNLT